MVCLRLIVLLLCLGFAAPGHAQSLPDAPRPSASLLLASASAPDPRASSAPALNNSPTAPAFSPDQTPTSPSQDTSPPSKPRPNDPVDANGNPIPLERREPRRILGIMPNFRTVSGGAQAHPAGFKYNFIVASHQAFDYSSFLFLGLTSITAEAFNEHPALGKGIEGMGQYTWRGLLDKTDNTYLSAWFLPTLLREDTRYFAHGSGHRVITRSLYTISQQAVARTYSGNKTFNFAGLGGKAITQYVSRYYYPPSAGTFDALATKFGYSVMRDVAFSTVREFYPDVAAHYVRKHREKAARRAAQPASPKPTPTSP